MISPTKRITRSHSRALTPSTPPTSSLPVNPKTHLIPTPPSSITSTTTSTSTSTSPNKKRKRPTPTSPPTTTSATKYAHIRNNLTDALTPNLILLFIGVNPGLTTALTGHAYAHPSNLFWKLLHSSRLTPRRCHPSETHALPRLYGLGNTNIVARPTRDASELSRAEMDAGVSVLEEKVRRWRPEAVCVVGKGIWEAIWRVRRGRGLRREEFRYGWQDVGENMGRVDGDGDGEEEGWEGARVFVATTTSGLAAGMRPWEKEEVWRPLGEWVCGRRREKGWVVEGEGEGRVEGKEKGQDGEAEREKKEQVAGSVEGETGVEG